MASTFTILIDGDCPLCAREARAMQRLDRGRGQLAFVDIAAPGFDPAQFGRTHAQVMGSIHGVHPDGRVVNGMEVFRTAYSLLGYGWLLKPTGWPVLKPAFDAAYRVFAWLRPRLPGRRCEGGTCRVPGSN